MSLFDPDRTAERTSLTVLTGFLGSGKTTLLNRLLRDPALADTAVIINEFGEIGLDHELVDAVDGERVLLKSGCICCTLRSDLETAVRDLLARRDRGDLPPFRRIVVETTGLADPAPILQMTLNNPLVSRFCVLEGVATTVDAVHAARHLAEHETARKQVAIADRLLVTKLDLAPVGDGGGDGGHGGRAGGPIPEALAGQLRAFNRVAPILALPAPQAGDGTFDVDAVLPRRAPDAGAQARRWLDFTPLPGRDAVPAATAAHDPALDGIEALCLEADEPLDWLALQDWLASLRAHHGEQLLRVKGIVHLRDEPDPVAIHGVHHVFHPPVRLERERGPGDRRSRLVFVLRHAPIAQIRSSFDEWVAVRTLLP